MEGQDKALIFYALQWSVQAEGTSIVWVIRLQGHSLARRREDGGEGGGVPPARDVLYHTPL